LFIQNICFTFAHKTKTTIMTQPNTNYVLIKPTRKSDELFLKSGVKLFIDDSIDPEKHAPTSGVVVSVPEKLFYSRKVDSRSSTAYNVPMELEVGDTVLFHYLSTENAKKDGRFYKEGDDEFYIIRYDDIHCRIREEEVMPVNGWVIVETRKEQVLKSDTIIIPDHIKNKVSEIVGKVKYIGSVVKEYYNDPENYDDDSIQEGDNVLFPDYDAILLEYSLHSVLGAGKYYRMHRRDILGVFTFQQ
jgi:co-chaperonin GroES (HSP10)